MPIAFDARIAQKVRRLFRADVIVVQRPAATVDAEGDATAGRSTVSTVTRGTLYSTTEAEDLVGAQRGTRIDKALALELGSDVQGHDFITVNGTTYEVVEVSPKRLYLKALLRVVAS